MDRHCALVFTDIVDSTAMNRRLGDEAMATVWQMHDDGARALLGQWNGCEVDRADGFFLTFDEAADAAGFLVAYHALLSAMAMPLRARAGLHVGTISVRSNNPNLVPSGKSFEIFGLAKAVASRLEKLALPGQTLASADAVHALAGSRWRCISHGHWRLKGVEEPAELWEVGDNEVAPFLPPTDSEKAQRVVRVNGLWVGLRDVPRNLPAERGTFLGRDDDLRLLSACFDSDARLVVVHGPGGIGKTRIALRYGWGWLGQYPGGVYFCDLTNAQTANGVLHGIARGIDVPLSAQPQDQLAHAIAARERSLLIVDNAEQVAADVARLLGDWLDRCPQVRFLVTSQVALGVAGEQIVTLGTLAQMDAATLFHDRARAAHRQHRESNWPDRVTRELMVLLDGLPLAIELAAARANLLSPEDMLSRMRQRFDLLRGGGERPPRQVTMRAAIDWSFRQLNDNERTTVAQLSIFEGGFTIAAAEAVVDWNAGGTANMLDMVQSLTAKSLLRVERAGRLSMFSAIHAYSADQLQASAAMFDEAVRRHTRHFGSFREQEATADRCADLDNLIVACRRACAMQLASDATRCLSSAWFALRLNGPFGTAVDLAQIVLNVATSDAAQRATAHWVAAAASLAMGELPPARKYAAAALKLLPGDAPFALRARIGCTVAEAEGLAGNDAAAHVAVAEAHAAALGSGDPGLQCHASSASGALALRRGLLDVAQDRYSEALAIAESAGLMRWQSGILGNLAMVAFQSGDLDRACERYERALALASDSGDRRWEANARCNLGLVRLEQRRILDAETELTSALTLARQLGHRALEYTTQCNLGLTFEARGNLAAACNAHAAAVVGMQALGDSQTEAQFRFYWGRALTQAERYSEARACLNRGLEMATVDNLPTRALLHCGVTEVAIAEDRPDLARIAYGTARDMLRRLQWTDNSELGQRIVECSERIEAVFGQSADGQA